MKKIFSDIAALVGQDSVVCIERKHIDDNHVDGFIAGVSDSLLLLHLVDGSTLLLNGYAVLRLRDITFWRVNETFVTRALRLLDRRPVVPNGIDLTDWSSLIASAQQQYPLVMIETEKKAPGCGYIGRLTKRTARHVVLMEVSPSGQWETEETRYAFSDITQVEFGDGYVQALAALVAHEAAVS